MVEKTTPSMEVGGAVTYTTDTRGFNVFHEMYMPEAYLKIGYW